MITLGGFLLFAAGVVGTILALVSGWGPAACAFAPAILAGAGLVYWGQYRVGYFHGRAKLHLYTGTISNGVKTRAQVVRVERASGPATDLTNNPQMNIWLRLSADSAQAQVVKHVCFTPRSRMPEPGAEVPVIVDPTDRRRLQILWDEIPTIDAQLDATT